VTWRLVEPQAAEPSAITERLRQATSDVRERERERRHTVIGVPPVVPAAPPVDAAAPRTEDVSRGHPDFERFLQYVRSLKP
jgi:hypothetical protein